MMIPKYTPAEEVFLAALSERAKIVFGFERSPDPPMAEDDLRRLLQAMRYPDWPVLFTLREQLGGLRAQQEGGRAGIRIFPTQSPWSPRARPAGALKGKPLVPIGFCTFGGQPLALSVDEDATLYRETGEPLAKSIHGLLEKLALLTRVEPLPPGVLLARLRPRVGTEVASDLGAAPIPEATDSFHQFWSRDGVLIADGHPFHDEANDSRSCGLRLRQPSRRCGARHREARALTSKPRTGSRSRAHRARRRRIHPPTR